MSTTPRLTLLGMYQYTEGEIFAGLDMPEGLDASDFVNRLLATRGELPVLWPDPDVMHSYITMWSENWKPNFTRIYATLTEQYDPLHNYNRFEEYTDTEGVGRSSSGTATGRNDSATENKVSAFNESAYQPDSQTTVGSGGSYSNTNTERVDRGLTHDAHLYGNIGVTTSQKMMEEELKIRLENRIYDIMGDVFAQELLILVY